jgi:hypothetical protein
MCSVKCPGLFIINAGYISSIDVVKGGEGNDITFDQRPSSIDLKISFQDVYSVLMTMSSDQEKEEEFRPTFSRYIETLRHSMVPPDLQKPGNGSVSPSAASLKKEQFLSPINQYVAPEADLQTASRVSQADIVESASLSSTVVQTQDAAVGSIKDSIVKIAEVITEEEDPMDAIYDAAADAANNVPGEW